MICLCIILIAHGIMIRIIQVLMRYFTRTVVKIAREGYNQPTEVIA